MKKLQVFGIVLLVFVSMSLAVPVLAQPPRQVGIDIKPLSCPNSINPNSRGKTPVAIITTQWFNAANVDPETVRFAGAEAVLWALNDFDGDGDYDLVLKFNTPECSFAGSGTYYLTGKTFGLADIWGKGWVNIVPN